jgi:hypothetical protein
MQENAGPVDHAGATTHGGHDIEEKGAVHRVKGFGDVNKDDGTGGIKGDHDSREEGGEGNVVVDEAGGEVGRLLRTDGEGHGRAKAAAEDLGQQPVASAEQSDRTVGSRVRQVWSFRLGDGANGAEGEATGEGACVADGSEEVGQEGGPGTIRHGPEQQWDAIRTRGRGTHCMEGCQHFGR